MNAHRIFSGGGMWRAAIVCAWTLAGIVAARGQVSQDAEIAEYNREIALNPKAADAYTKRGRAESSKGDKEMAMEDFNRAIQLNPKLVEPWFERARLKEARGDLEGAVADVSRAIKLDPGNADYYEWRASEEASLGDDEAAEADDNRAKDLDPKHAGNPAPERTPAPAPADQSAALRITLDIHPELGEDADIREIADAVSKLDCSDPDAHFCLVVENVSSKPVVLETEQTHVPYFEVTDEKGAAFSVCRPPLPAGQPPMLSIILAPKEKTVIEIPYVMSDVSYPFPHPAPGTSLQVTIRAVLQFKPGPDLANELPDYWTGRVVSEACRVTLTGGKQADKP